MLFVSDPSIISLPPVKDSETIRWVCLCFHGKEHLKVSLFLVIMDTTSTEFRSSKLPLINAYLTKRRYCRIPPLSSAVDRPVPVTKPSYLCIKTVKQLIWFLQRQTERQTLYCGCSLSFICTWNCNNIVKIAIVADIIVKGHICSFFFS